LESVDLHDPEWMGYGMLVNIEAGDSKAQSGVCSTASGSWILDTQTAKMIPGLLAYSDSSTQIIRTPPPVLRFPLSADHCLITLVQYNVVRGIIMNLMILSRTDQLPAGCISSMQISQVAPPRPPQIPPDLRPTALQISVPHPFWIDAIPFQRVRDNMILMTGQYDSDALMFDLGRGIYEGFDDTQRRGFLVWRDPWSAAGWEISDGFVKKWGFLLAGCTEVFESSNHWREARGEERLAMNHV
jgi:hypothetical protein